MPAQLTLRVAHLQQNCRLQLFASWASNGAQSNEVIVFTRPSILFRPQIHPPNDAGVIGGAAGYRPRVRAAYYTRVYRYSPQGTCLI